ncbi:MAG: hypothetical protein ACD_13C00104G0002 [uncultured bacterium]|nr:MAG: hypothetical protein ACD_13C00104G0002 [uncultured bacterium]
MASGRASLISTLVLGMVLPCADTSVSRFVSGLPTLIVGGSITGPTSKKKSPEVIGGIQVGGVVLLWLSMAVTHNSGKESVLGR